MTSSFSPDIEQLLAGLYRDGVRLWLEDGRLRCSGPAAVLGAELEALLRERRDELVRFLSQRTADIASSARLVARERTSQLPLSFAQQRLWFLDRLQPDSAVYNLPLALEIKGMLDVAALRASLSAIVARHEVLRTRIHSVDGEQIQHIAAAAPLELPVLDLRGTPEQRTAIEAAAKADAEAIFDLERDPPLRARALRVAEQEWIVLFTVHHIAADAWSLDLLLQELVVHYRSALLGLPAKLPALPIQYADFALWQREHLQGPALTRDLEYWRAQLADAPSALQLPTDFARPRVQTFRGAVAGFALTPASSARLKALGQAQGASLFMTLLAAFKILLYRYTGQRDVLVGTPVANRDRAELEALIGLFVNTLVLRTRLEPTASFTHLLERVRATALEAYAHQDLPFEKLVEALQPARDLSLSPFFQVKFRLENAPAARLALPGLELRRLPQAVSVAKLDLSVDVYETPAGLVGGFEYNADLFSAERMANMARHFEILLEAIARDPAQSIATLPLLTDEEVQRQLRDWNATERPYEDERCFQQLFEAQVARTPDALALIYDGPTEVRLTYTELNERSNRLAHCLQARGVGPETVVGICLERSPDMVIALLAVLKAGGAYLPLDPEYPAERLAFMLEDAQAALVLTHGDLTLPATAQRLDLDASVMDDWSQTNPACAVGPQHLAYLIYTSGSTGLPKGVLVPHGGLVNLTEDKIRVCDVRAGDRVLQFFSFSFDASIPEFIMTLATGAALVLAPANELMPGPGLKALLIRNAVTHVTMTPSALTALPAGDFPALRMVLVGGEAPSVEMMEQWSAGGRRFINAYGPTETTVNASMVECGNGRPLAATLAPSANKQLYVLDENLQLLPNGVIGELHIGGVGLARGYHARPALTAERFVPNPFPPVRAQRYRAPVLYKTGDLACHLPDGRIRVMGRIDHQIKIRGFRIELGEIERVLEQHPAIKAGVVIAREDAPGVERLIAYGVAAAGFEASAAEIRQFLGGKLPQFMVPGAFVWLEALPLTPNGKIDLQALPPPAARDADTRLAPRTPAERTLAGIFAAVLGVQEIGVDDDFFDLGGHSLLATKLVAQLHDHFAVDVSIMDLFKAPTVAALAQRIEHKQHLAPLLDDRSLDDGAREEVAL